MKQCFFLKMIIEKNCDITKVVIKLHIDAKFHTKKKRLIRSPDL